MNTIHANKCSAGYAVRVSLAGHHAAKFPKYVGAKNGTVFTMENTTEPCTIFNVHLFPKKGNAVNEAGAKRLKRFLSVCEAEGLTLEDRPKACLNSVSIHDVLGAL